MRIGIDIRSLSEGKLTGVEVYTTKLLQSLFEIDKKNEYILFYNSRKPAPKVIKAFVAPNIRLKAFSYPNKLLNFSFKFLKRPKIDELVGGLDVLFSPNILFFAVSEKCKTVVTFHDLSFEAHKEFFTRWQRLWHFLVNPRHYARKADAVIAVSESTKRDLVGIYNLPEEKVFAIHSGVDMNNFDDVDNGDIEKAKEKYGIDSEYLLYFGTIEPRKNVETIIEAFDIFKSKTGAQHKLVIAGVKGWLYGRVFRKAERSKFKNDIIFTGFVSDEDKDPLFKGACLFVYPSFYEGFGFPPLEAMSMKVPVVTSNVSSLPEVVGNAAIMVDPYNVQDVVDAIGRGIMDEDLRKQLIKRGLERIDRFTWERAARETLNVLEEAGG